MIKDSNVVIECCKKKINQVIEKCQNKGRLTTKGGFLEQTGRVTHSVHLTSEDST